MVDVVVNHMGYYCGASHDGDCGPQGTINYSIYNPFNSEKYFHPFCEINYDNATSILDVSTTRTSFLRRAVTFAVLGGRRECASAGFEDGEFGGAKQ